MTVPGGNATGRIDQVYRCNSTSFGLLTCQTLVAAYSHTSEGVLALRVL